MAAGILSLQISSEPSQAIFQVQTFSLHPILYLVNTLDHYANMPMQYTTIFHGRKKNNFLIKIVIFFLFLLSEAVLTSIHNLCFRAKIRKNVYLSKPHFYYIKVGCKGVYITRTCWHDAS